MARTPVARRSPGAVVASTATNSGASSPGTIANTAARAALMNAFFGSDDDDDDGPNDDRVSPTRPKSATRSYQRSLNRRTQAVVRQKGRALKPLADVLASNALRLAAGFITLADFDRLVAPHLEHARGLDARGAGFGELSCALNELAQSPPICNLQQFPKFTLDQFGQQPLTLDDKQLPTLDDQRPDVTADLFNHIGIPVIPSVDLAAFLATFAGTNAAGANSVEVNTAEVNAARTNAVDVNTDPMIKLDDGTPMPLLLLPLPDGHFPDHHHA